MKRLSLCIRYWRACNNKCSFCFEENNSFDNMFFKPSKDALDKNNDAIFSLVDSNEYDFFTFKIMGGELFAYPYIAESLKDTIVKLHNVYNQKGLINFIQNNYKVPETLVIASNLLYKDRSSLQLSLDALKNLPNIKATMMVSYDLDGRFKNENAFNLYLENYKWIFNNYYDVVKPVVSFVLSKQNIKALLSGHSLGNEIFNELYNMNAPFDMSLLLNDSHVNDFKYDQKTFDSFIELMLDKYPRLLNVYRDTKNYRHYNTTRKTIQGGIILNEQHLYGNNSMNCLLCKMYKKCHHSYSEISYNAFDCDVKRILEKCENY